MRFLRPFVTALLAGFAFAAAAQPADPPGRVGRISHAEGPVSHLAAGSNAWTAASFNRPVVPGDRIWVPAGSRAELHIGSTAVRLNGQTALDVVVLDDDNVRLSLLQGSLAMMVRNIYPDEQIEVGTPNGAVVFGKAGRLRLDVDTARNTTRVALASGAVTVYGERGRAMDLGARQQAAFTGRDLGMAPIPQGASDAFERWASNRERLEERSVSARYVPREVIGYQQLDAYGQWSNDPNYGAVWYPRVPAADWAPYRYGHWSYIEPWGWTWVDDAPWGFAPFHYGRWAQIGPRWAWIPGRPGPRPAYAPALVSFIGSVGGADISISIGGGRRGVAWVPLGPGEAWRPPFAASPRYLGNVNRAFPNTVAGSVLFNQRRGNAVTALDADDFQRGRRSAGRFQRPDADDLARARAVAAPQVDRGRAQARPEAAAPAAAAPAAVRTAVVESQRAGDGRRGDGRRDGDRRDNDRRDGDRRFGDGRRDAAAAASAPAASMPAAAARVAPAPVASAPAASAPAPAARPAVSAPASIAPTPASAPAAAAPPASAQRPAAPASATDARRGDGRRGDDRRQDDDRRRDGADPRRDASAPRPIQVPAAQPAPQAMPSASQPRAAEPAQPQRNAGDAQRQAAEQQRQAAEQQRQAAEQQRQRAAQQAADQQKAAADQQRAAADQQRAAAEQQRAAQQKAAAEQQQRAAAEQQQRAAAQQRQAAPQVQQPPQPAPQAQQQAQPLRGAAPEQRQQRPQGDAQPREGRQRDGAQREGGGERQRGERGGREGQEQRPGRSASSP